jgi:hypothetical protein
MSNPNGKELLSATWALLRKDKSLMWLPLVGSVFGILAAAIFFAPGYGIGWLINGQEQGKIAYYAGVALSGLGATIVGVFFQTALVIGANERAEGGEPTPESCLRAAWRLRWRILTWSILTATVGMLFQIIQERLGFLGAIVRWVGGLAWGIATIVVVPVLVAEEVGPITAIKRSAQVLRDTWGTSLRTAGRGFLLSFGLWLGPAFVLCLGLGMAFGGSDQSVVTLGIALIAVAVVAIIALGTILSAVEAYARALIYRYAVGLPTPGIETRVLAGALQTK